MKTLEWHALPDQGVFVAYDGADLYYSPMLEDGTMEIDPDGEYSTVDCIDMSEQDTLDKINALFGTAYTFDDFPGR